MFGWPPPPEGGDGFRASIDSQTVGALILLQAQTLRRTTGFGDLKAEKLGGVAAPCFKIGSGHPYVAKSGDVGHQFSPLTVALPRIALPTVALLVEIIIDAAAPAR
jgi:hypothetical protein